jgi:F-type H+-transporting ATPase subunit a
VPEHSFWLTLLLAHVQGTLEHNAGILGDTLVGKHPPTWHSFEPIAASIFVALLLLTIAVRVRVRLAREEEAIVPEDRLTLRTFMEAFLAYFYDLAKSVMGPERAKTYFPVIGILRQRDGAGPGHAGRHQQPRHHAGLGAGGLRPVQRVRPARSGGRVHQAPGRTGLVAGASLVPARAALALHPARHLVRALVAVFLPLPVMVLGCLVVVVQTLVFTLLTCIYIGLATEGHDSEHHA